MAQPRLPAFASLLKSRDVEDPVNLWLHRPLAYAFVALVYRTRLTPNQITFMSLVVGLAAVPLWLWGARGAMVAGGILLWASAILDGADGILARAKNQHSQFGRALDGSADMIVAAGTVFAGFAHLWMQQQQPIHMILALPAIGGAVLHIFLYDFYKESFLRMTRPGTYGEPENHAQVRTRLAELEAKGGSLLLRITLKQLFIPLLQNQDRVIAITNPDGRRGDWIGARDEETARIYRRHNLGPMRLWAIVSLAPHAYLMSICAILDRLDVYLWIRLVVMNVLFIVVLVWQRRATTLTRRELSEGGPPDPVPAVQAA